MTKLDPWFDLLLGALILALAWRTLSAQVLYQSAVLFIAFGLSMALAWARLAAPDVALAEAAIGTGLLGVLLIDSLRVFGHEPGRPEDGKLSASRSGSIPRGSLPATASVVLGAAILGGVLTAAIVQLPETGGLTGIAAENLDRSGVAHPVTAVLLNFRGYDTWLEVGVLLLAMFGIFAAGGYVGFRREDDSEPLDAVLAWLIRALVPILLLTGGYLLWLGKFAPGGAFQSGVVLGAAGIFLRLAGVRCLDRLPVIAWKGGLLLGFGGFLLFGISASLSGGGFLEYPAEWAGLLILLIETAAAISIGFTLVSYFIYLNSADRDTASGGSSLSSGSPQS